MAIKTLKRFNKIFADLNSCRNHDLDTNDVSYLNILGEKFDNFNKLIRKKIVIKIFNAISKKLFVSLTGKELILLFIFSGFPEFSLDSVVSEMDCNTLQGKIYKISIKIISLWEEILMNKNEISNLIKMTGYIDLFEYYYRIFINTDKIAKINQLIQRWLSEEEWKEEVESKDDLNNEQKTKILKFIETQQKESKKLLKIYFPKFEESTLENYKQLSKKIKDNIHDIYWKNIIDNMKEGDNEDFINLLKELKSELLEQIPKGKTKDKTKEELDEYMDVEFISSMINNRAYDHEDFFKLCEYLVTILEKLHAPNCVPTMKKQWIKIMESNKNKDDDFLKNKEYITFLFKEIEILKENIASICVLNDMGINVFNL